MKAEYTIEDFKRAIKNPYYTKLNKEVVAVIRNEVYDVITKVRIEGREQ